MKNRTAVNLLMLVIFVFGQLPIPTATAKALPAIQTTPAMPAPSMPANTPAASPAPAPTQPAPNPQPDPAYQISLSATPEFITQGGKALIQWTVTGPDLSGDDMLFTVPAGVNVSNLAGTGVFNPDDGTFRVSARQRSGYILLNVPDGIEMPVTVTAALVGTGPAITWTDISLMDKASVDQTGGDVRGLNGKVAVAFPAGAVKALTDVFIHRPLPASMPTHSLSGKPFEITARDSAAKTRISRFNQELDISVSYADYNFPSNVEDDLVLSWYDPTQDTWFSLPTHVDRATKTLTARSTHFTVFDINVDNWQASHLPALDAAQTSSYTGGASYSIPIEVPSGPGGLKPDITLSYNSQLVDNASILTQASWVGMGWSLDVGGIERNSNGTPLYTGDDSFMVTINNTSSTLVFDGVNYHMSSENHWKVEKIVANNSWKITDTAGNIYFFEKLTTLNTYPENKHCAKNSLDVRWSLTRMRNIFGQELVYTYTDETKRLMIPTWRQNQKGNWVCGSTLNYENSNTATILASIEYANSHYRVRFVSEARSDYDSAWITDISNHAFERSRLKEIVVEYDNPALPGAYETVVRRYGLEYFADSDTANLVFPGVTWTAGGKTPTLKKVTQYDAAGTALPSTEFSYVDDDTTHLAADDNLHLKKVSNGYGGSVTFVYERWGNIEGSYPAYASEYHTLAEYFGKPTFFCGGGFPGFEARNTGDSVTCPKYGPPTNVKYGDMLVNGSGILLNLSKNLVTPGGLYRLWANWAPDGVSSLDLGFYDGASDSFVGGASGVISLAPTASRLNPIIKDTGTGRARIYKYKLELLSAGWRVVSRTVAPAGANPLVTTYAYAGVALNSSANSLANMLCAVADPFNPGATPACTDVAPAYSEFRGHSQVTETGPDGQITTTYYLQDQLQQGKPYRVTVQAGGAMLNESLYTYGNTSYTSLIKPPVVEGCSVGDCLFHGLTWVWMHTDSVENRLYARNGSYQAALQVYTYESTYGNQIGTLSQAWNGTAWVNYRKSETEYKPNVTGGAYLASYPARQVTSKWDGNGWAALSESLNIYDANSLYSQPPSVGVLAATRTLAQNSADYIQVGYGYDAYGNRTSQTTFSDYGTAGAKPPSSGRTSSTIYDGDLHVYPITLTDELGHITAVTYDKALGVPLSETDPNNVTTSAQYDGFGRITKLVRPGDSSATPTMEFSYTVLAGGLKTTVSQHLDGLRGSPDTSRYEVIERTYDSMGRQVKQTSGSLVGTASTTYATTDTIYDTAVVTRQSAPYAAGENPVYTTTVVDPANQMTTMTAPDGSQTVTSQDGLTTTAKDANGNSTTQVKDIWGRVTGVTPPTGPGVSYEYDIFDQLTTATRGGATTSLTYDNAGRKTHMSDADMGSWYYYFDAAGNLIAQVDAKSQATNLYYDNLNRIIGKTYTSSVPNPAAYIRPVQPVNPSDFAITYIFDAGANGIGHRTSMIDGSGTTAWTYDILGRMTSENKTFSGVSSSFTTSWTYNPAGLPLTMTYPDGETLNYSYNDRTQLTTLSGTNSYITNTVYDTAGRMTSRALGNNLTQTYTYNSWNTQGGRLASITTGTLQNLAYTYDPTGNITQITDNVANEKQTYRYDALDRLRCWGLTALAGTSGCASYKASTDTFDATLTASDAEYKYDPSTGNLSQKDGTTLAYLNPGHKHAVSDAGSNTYEYDLNGNQTKRTINGQEFNLSYEAENRLVEVKSNGTSVAQFTFDGDGKRVMSVMGGETIRFVGNYYEQKGTGEVTKYYFAGTSMIATRKYTIPQNMQVEYTLSDHLNSAAITTDSAGVKVSEIKYKPWGEIRDKWTNTAIVPLDYSLTKLTYTGQYSYMDDPTTTASEGFGLMFYQARWYDPLIGRFSSPDSLIPDNYNTLDWDRYLYARGNPVKYNDPSGHCPMCVTAAIGAAIGLAVNYGFQAVQNHYEKNESWSESFNFQNIDKGQLVAAGVGGLVAGVTMGIAAPALAGTLTSEFAAYTLAGSAANTIGGLAEAETLAVSNQVSDIASGETFDMQEFTSNAQQAGVNIPQMAFNFGTGGLTAGATFFPVRAYTGPIYKIPNAALFDDLFYASKNYLVGSSAAIFNSTISTGQEITLDYVNKVVHNKEATPR